MPTLRCRTDLPCLNFSGGFGIANVIGVKVHHGNDDAVFYFAFAQLVQVRLPTPIFSKVFGDALWKKDVSGVAAIHHPLRDVDAGPGDMNLIYIGH